MSREDRYDNRRRKQPQNSEGIRTYRGQRRRTVKHAENDIFFEDVDIDDDEDYEADFEDSDYCDYDDDYEDDFEDSDYDDYDAEEHYGSRNTSRDRNTGRNVGNRKKTGDQRSFREDKELRSPQKRRKKKSVVRRILTVLAILLIAFAALLIYNNFSKGNDWTIAVFGVDGTLNNGSRKDGVPDKNTRTDVIMLVNIDRKTGEVKLCSVFRDTYLKIDKDDNYNKINAAYERGGIEQAVWALEENLDVKIDDYGVFSWGSVATAINAVGGIDLEITSSEFKYINSFITETVQATGIPSVHLSGPGYQHLDGVQAVAYGRLRLMDTDFNRTARQRKVLSLALEKAKSVDPLALIAVGQEILKTVSTSIDMGDVIPIISTLSKFSIPDGASQGFPFSRTTMDVGKLDCVVATTLESNVIELHRFLFGDENYQPSSSVKSISEHIASVTGLGTPGEDAAVPNVGGNGGGTPAPTETAPLPSASVPEESSTESTESTEESGESLFETDENGDPIERETDENGDPIVYETDDDGLPIRRPSESKEEDDAEDESKDHRETEEETTREPERETERETSHESERETEDIVITDGPGSEPTTQQADPGSGLPLDHDAPVTQPTEGFGPGSGL